MLSKKHVDVVLTTMKTQLPSKQFLRTFKLIILVVCSIIVKPAQAVFPIYGLSTPAATLDPMSGGTITPLVPINTNDGVSGVTSIGFTFNFNGVNQTLFSVNSNGLMRIGASAVSNTATNSLASGTDLPKIAAYNDDLRTVAGTVRSKIIGSAPSRQLVVDWNVTIVNTNTPIQFQVWLFETSNNIQFVYGAGTPANPGNYTVGIATATTVDFSSITVASTFSSSTVSNAVANNSNTQAIGASNSFLYTPPPTCPLQTTPASLATNVAVNTTINWTAGATGTTSVYDVYFGTAANPPLVTSDQVGLTYNPGALLNNTVYFWKIVGKNGTITVASSSSCTIRQFTTVPLPSCATSLSPVNLATLRPLTTTLSWAAGAGTVPTGYDVYFGTTASPPLVSTNQAGTTYNPGTLTSNTNYFWKIVPRNGNDLATGCTIIQFTTVPLPSCATSLSPANLATNQPSTTILSWSAGAGTVPTGYDVYFGTAASPPLVSTNQAGTTYNPGSLNSYTVYYWKIVPRNGSELATGCTIIQFTTIPSCATSLSPAHLATLRPLTTILSWSAGAGTAPTGYDVYFGTATNPPIVSTNQAGTTYNPGTLISNTNYYWKIIPRNGSDLATGCSISQFTTVPLPSCATSFSPAHLATLQPLTTILSWSAGAGTAPTGYDVYFGTATTPPLVSTNQAGTTYNPGTLISNTNYYWKIIPRNGNALATGCTTIQFTTVPLPSCAASQSPAHLATLRPLTTTLSWSAGAGTVPTGYDVYFGTVVNPPLVSTNQVGTTHNPGTLISNTNYYWKIIPRNGSDLATGCTVIQFTTVPVPSCATSLSPAHLATLRPLTTTLSWAAGAGTVPTAYDVYFGTVASPPLVSTNQAGTSYNPGTLISNTNYFWKIVPRNGSALATGCSISQFTTVPLPLCATSPSPSDLSANKSLETILSWSAGAGTVPTGYDVYFGNTTNPPLVSINQASATYNAGILSFNTTYFWKIVPRNGNDLAVGCSEFQFTTRSPLTYNVSRTTGISYTSISGTGNSVPGVSWRNGTDTDDNLSNALPIGFNFTYDGNTYSSFLVSTNGFITFNINTTATGSGTPPYHYLNSNLTGITTPTSPLMLAPFYDDITCQGQGSNLLVNLDNGIKFLTTGSAGSRVLTIQWAGMELFTTSGPNLNFQLKLYEGSNTFDFIYGNMETFNGTFNHAYSYSVGINATNVSSVPQLGEVLCQQIANTRSFAKTSQTQITASPECNSSLRFTPVNYTPYVPVSLVPPNDSLGAPIHLNVNPSPCIDLCGTYYKSALATPSGGTPTCFGTPDDDVWFEFTAINAVTTIKVAGSGNYDPTVELFNAAHTSLACANNVGIGLSETLNLTNLVIGQQYVIRVFHRSSGSGANSSGEFSICVSATPVAPLNDNCNSNIALPITANQTTGTSTLAATASAGIPSCGLPNGENPDDDVWYSFTALKAIEVIKVVGNNGFNAVIQLFSGNCGNLTSIGCMNSFGNGQIETLTKSGLTINVVYYIRVFHAGLGGGSGSFSISVSSPPPPCTVLMLPPDQELNMSGSGIDLIWEPVVGADNYIVKFGTVNPPTIVLGNTTDTTIFTGILTQNTNYYWQLIPGNGNSYNNSCPVNKFTTEERPIALSLRLFLQELYLTNRTMKTVLNPLDTIADSIAIHLYDEFNELQYSSLAELSINGFAKGYFPLIALDSPYYLVVTHRNSLETWSRLMFTLTNDSFFDFSSSLTAVYGGNLIQVQTGTYALYCGDVTQDGYINYQDVDSTGRSAANFDIGYFPGDINADGYVESLDLSILENRAPRAKKTPFPPFGP